MTDHAALPERLRQAFALLDESERAEGRCPEPGTIWDAVHARLAPAAVEGVVLHIGSCPACAHDWRIAMRSEHRLGAVKGASAAGSGRTRGAFRTGLVAAAAMILGAALLVVFRSDPLTDLGPVYRAPEPVTILSLVPEHDSLPREDAVLRWSPVGEDARYTLEIHTLDLAPVARAHDLSTAEYRIAPEKLEGLASGEVIVWTVEARSVDGRRIKSKAFRHRVR